MSTHTINRSNDSAHVEPTVHLRDADKSPVDTIIAKFTVNKRAMVPAGIAERQRGTDEQSDVRQQLNTIRAGQADLAEVGRVREGRVDSGEQRIIVEGNPTNVDFLRRNLTSSGFRLTQVQYYERVTDPGKPWSKTKYVIECIFTRVTAELEPYDTTKIDDALRQLATTSFNFCYVWVNPDLTCTINLSGRAPDVDSHGSLKVVDGELQFVKNGD